LDESFGNLHLDIKKQIWSIENVTEKPKSENRGVAVDARQRCQQYARKQSEMAYSREKLTPNKA
jgi:hypothetical protein